MSPSEKKGGLSREVILYLVFGVLTTVLNIAVQFGISFAFGLDDPGKVWIANPIAWVAGVIFAYATNRIFVFQSKTEGKALALEAGQFIFARLITLLFDQLIMMLLVGNVWFADRLVADILSIGLEEANNLDSKIIANVVVIILNYLFSKLIIFRKDKKETA